MRISKIRSMLLVFIFIVSSSFLGQVHPASAEEYYSFDSGLIVEGRTLLPMRSLFESLGTTIQWDQKTKTVQAKRADKTISLTIGSKQAKVNGTTVTLDVPALIVEGSTYVPVRFAAESLGAEIAWNSFQKKTTVYSGNIVVDIYVYPALNVSGVDTSFLPNTSYTYVYYLYEGIDKQTFYGKKGNEYYWNSQYSYGDAYPVEKIFYKESQYGLYTGYPSWGYTVQEIKYPAYVGQSWVVEGFGGYSTRTIIAVGSTIQTSAKTFTNVIEVIDDTGIVRFYAKGFGLVYLESYEEPSFYEELAVLKKR